MLALANARRGLLLAAILCGSGAAQGQVPLEVLCSVTTEWCTAVAGAFTKQTGIPVRTTQKAAADAFALLSALRGGAASRYDLWYGAVGDLHIAAAQAGLIDEYRSPHETELRDWAVRFAEQSGHRSVALYQRPIGLVVNTKRRDAKQLPEPRCWTDVADPRYDDELQMTNPDQGSAMRATIISLVTVYGETRALEILKGIHKNVVAYTRRATNAARAVARGDATFAIAYFYDGAAEVAAGFPVKLVAPCEGVAVDVVAMSIIKGTRSGEAARKFYDWALTPEALGIAYSLGFWQMPAHRKTPLHPNVWNTDDAKTIPNDFARVPVDARRRLYSTWEREIGILPR